MDDEIKLMAARNKAERAQGLLNNELLTEAFKGLEDAYTAAWRASTADQAGQREKLYLAINIVGKVKEHLTTIVNNGKLAANDLKQIAETAERKSIFRR